MCRTGAALWARCIASRSAVLLSSIHKIHCSHPVCAPLCFTARHPKLQQDHLPFWHFPAKGAGKGLGQGTGDIIEYIGTLRPSTFVRPYAWMVCSPC